MSLTPRFGFGRSGYITGSLTETFPGHADWDEVGTSAAWLDWSEREDILSGRSNNGQYFRVDRWRVLSGFISGFGNTVWGNPLIAHSYLPTRYSFGNGTAIQGLLPKSERIADNDLQYLYTGFVNSTNPGRNEANYQVSLVELREVPSLLRQAKDLIRIRRLLRTPIRSLSNNYLAYQFGIRPLVSDIQTMLSLPQLIQSRMKELSELRDSGISKKTRRLYANSYDRVGYEWATTWPIIMPYRERFSTSNSVWGHVNWIADANFRSLSQEDLTATARNAIIGGNIGLNDLYELIPWTWLNDYFASTGDYLTYINNRIPGVVDRGSVMCRTFASLYATYDGPPLGDLKIPPVILYRDSKYRIPGQIGAYYTSLDVLSGHQLSIISALIGSSRAGYTRTA